MQETRVDIAVIGAGITGLVCARHLQQAGYQTVILEKSRGLGGRLATRRLEGTWADHGTRYLEPQGKWSDLLIQTLCDRGIVHLWTESLYQWVEGQLSPLEHRPCYVAKDGITAIAKYLGANLNVQRQQRVTAITPQAGDWSLTLEATGTESLTPITARAIVIAIPAPQAMLLLQPLAEVGLPDELLTAVGSVQFDPCFSAIATYPAARVAELASLPWCGVIFKDDVDLSWVGLESRKQTVAQQPVVVVQSSARFAAQSLEETNLQPIGQRLLTRAAEMLIPWLDTATILQVHRWRYAFAQTPLSTAYLATTNPLPLVCGGDWCGGNNLESALQSGMAIAHEINQRLDQRSMPELTVQ
ncbi:MAG: FAD-dependent oxidoreductase [Oculatellaceae cyanobacterium bins.114]|nr:FAD-dependent oxidoreductase [Oculatellaceae cyanobacterium bins.114]